MIVGCALRGLFFCMYVPGDGIMINGMVQRKMDNNPKRSLSIL